MTAVATLRQIKHSLPWKKAKTNSRPRSSSSHRYTKGLPIATGRGATATPRLLSDPDDDGPFEIKISSGTDQAYYFFSDEEDNGEDDDGDRILFKMSELRPRGKRTGSGGGGGGREPGSPPPHGTSARPRPAHTDVQIIERQILPGDSLQSFALQYGCPVGVLKQANKLVSDQDFHALTHIKLPIKKYSLLTEIQHEIRQRPQLAAHLELPPPPPPLPVLAPSDDDDGDFELRMVGITNCLQDDDSTTFLTAMDRDLAKIRRSTSSYKNNLEEVRDSLTSLRFFPLDKTRSDCDSPDCGLKWWYPVAAMIVMCVIAPLLYFLLFRANWH